MKEMNTYEIFFNGYNGSITVPAKSASAAKYTAFLYLDIDIPFKEFLQKYVKCVKLLHKFRVSDVFGDEEQFERMKRARNIPFAYMGQPVILHSHSRGELRGVIVGANAGQNLNVLFSVETDTRGNILKFCIENCHPHYRMTYLDADNRVLAEYAD